MPFVFFYNIYGSPEPKKKHFEKIFNDFKFDKSEVVFIGDSKNDYVLARNNKLNFIAFGDKIKLANSTNNFTILKFSELNNVLKRYK